ncbi:MAG: hypothetical protein ACE5GR_00470 [Nitrosopumilus sp.]
MTFHKYLLDAKMFEYDKHYRNCKQSNIPFIKAKNNPKHRNYFVQIDLITCNYELSYKKQDEIKKLIESEITFIKLNSNFDFQGFSIDKELAWFDGIPLEHVDNFCKNLYSLTQKNH